MATGKEYFEYVCGQLSDISDISYRKMMGEYIIYFKGKVIGGIYDDRFLIKCTNATKAMMPNAALELPYQGAKEMLLVEELDNRDFLNRLFSAISNEVK